MSFLIFYFPSHIQTLPIRAAHFDEQTLQKVVTINRHTWSLTVEMDYGPESLREIGGFRSGEPCSTRSTKWDSSTPVAHHPW